MSDLLSSGAKRGAKYPPMMVCGHTANSQKADGSPCCVICYGIVPGADKVVPSPDLTGRTARCHCGRKEPSDFNLAFFQHTPGTEFDSYYCGHFGWD